MSNEGLTLTPSVVVSVPASKDWPWVKAGSPKTVIAETTCILEFVLVGHMTHFRDSLDAIALAERGVGLSTPPARASVITFPPWLKPTSTILLPGQALS